MLKNIFFFLYEVLLPVILDNASSPDRLIIEMGPGEKSKWVWKKKAKGKKRKTKHTLGDSINLVQISVRDLRDQAREQKYSKDFVVYVYECFVSLVFHLKKQKGEKKNLTWRVTRVRPWQSEYYHMYT